MNQNEIIELIKEAFNKAQPSIYYIDDFKEGKFFLIQSPDQVPSITINEVTIKANNIYYDLENDDIDFNVFLKDEESEELKVLEDHEVGFLKGKNLKSIKI